MDAPIACSICGATNPPAEPFCRSCGAYLGDDRAPVVFPVGELPHLPIAYGVGNEHNPVDPFGRIALDISEAGAATLRHVSRTGQRAWTATVRPDVLESLRAAIGASGFPQVEREVPLPDSEVRSLTVGPYRAEVWPRAAGQPSYEVVFHTLDAIADEMSGGTIRRRLPADSLVSSIRPV